MLLESIVVQTRTQHRGRPLLSRKFFFHTRNELRKPKLNFSNRRFVKKTNTVILLLSDDFRGRPPF